MIRAVGAAETPPERFGEGFPRHIHPSDIALKLAGAGGDGAQTAAMLIAQAGIDEGFDATHIPSYGPSRAAALPTPTSTSRGRRSSPPPRLIRTS